MPTNQLIQHRGGPSKRAVFWVWRPYSSFSNIHFRSQPFFKNLSLNSLSIIYLWNRLRTFFLNETKHSLLQQSYCQTIRSQPFLWQAFIKKKNTKMCKKRLLNQSLSKLSHHNCHWYSPKLEDIFVIYMITITIAIATFHPTSITKPNFVLRSKCYLRWIQVKGVECSWYQWLPSADYLSEMDSRSQYTENKLNF